MNKRPILLINSNRMRPPVAPLALDYIGGHLRQCGYAVELLDLCWAEKPEQAIRAQLSKTNPLLIGITFRNSDDCYLFSRDWFVPQLKTLVDSIKKNSDAPIVLGGCGFSVFPRPVMDACGVDLGIVGDGEIAMALLAEHLQNGKGYHDIPGLACRNAAGDVVINPPAYEATLSVPPDRSLLDNASYFREGAMGNVETKRGCPMPCIYCADPVAKGPRVRCRRPQEVADECAALLRQGVDVLHLCDGEFNIPPEHALAVCHELIERGLGERIKWYAYAGVKPFPVELAETMRRAGCVGINFGVDSGSDRMLAVLKRGFTKEDIARTVHACKQAGLIVMLDMLLGGPSEDRDSVAESIEFIKRLNPDRAGAATGLRIYPGTPLAEMVRVEGPMAPNPNLVGCTENNHDFFRPVFYLEHRLGDHPAELVVDLIDGDQRFFPPPRTRDTANYNYNDNRVLEEAIAAGQRGAFWDILRKIG